MTLLSETGEFYLNNPESQYCLFAYRGDSDFLRRMENLFHNFGILESGEVHQIQDHFHYILTPLHRLKKGLTECFRAETITGGDQINKVFKEIVDEDGDITNHEIEWDSGKVEELANNKLGEFMSKVRTDAVAVYLRAANVHETYKLGTF